jgi:hypothetical protein
MILSRRLALTSLIAVAGCSSMPKPPPGLRDDQAIVAPKLVMTIPAPAQAGSNVELAQSIVAHFSGQSFALELRIVIDPEKLYLVAMDGFGRRAMTVTFTRGAPPQIEQADWLPVAFRPADILAAFVIVYWPQDVVAGAMKGDGVTVITQDKQRRVSRDGKDLIVVDYGQGTGWDRSATLKNIAFGYDITVQSARVEP